MKKKVNKKNILGQKRNPVSTLPQKVTESEASGITSKVKTEIEKAAYYRWVNSGCLHGNDQNDWFEVEKNIRIKK
ncbi:MAG: DUF2934 domain-containing protein [Planctomycetota bacterium]